MKCPTKAECEKILESVGQRRKVLETSIQAVVQGYVPAAFVWGPPGLGKTHILTRLLDALSPGNWKHHTAYSTPKALMLSLAENPAAIHLFEDCERMMKTDLAASILRAACGAPDGKPRWVTYETAHEILRVNVTGGIIIATNESLARKNGPMAGVASRFRPVQWTLSLQERIASILLMGEDGYARGKTVLTAKECLKVATELVNCLEEIDAMATIDLRLYSEHALPIFAHCKAIGEANWQDVILSKISGSVATKEEGQVERTRRLEVLAQTIRNGPGGSKEKVAMWKEKTGLGQAIYYRHLKRGKKG